MGGHTRRDEHGCHSSSLDLGHFRKEGKKSIITLAGEDVLGGKRAPTAVQEFFFRLYFSHFCLGSLSHIHGTALSCPALAARRDGTGHMNILPIAVSLAV